MIYFVYLSYRPNTAPANRALAYLKSADRMGIPIQVLYLLPDENRSKLSDEFQNVKVKYCWDRFFIDNPYLKYLSYFFYLLMFVRQLKEGDKVYIYSLNDIIRRLVNKKGVDFYYEITECPEVSLTTTELCKPSIIKHLDFCKKVKSLFVISSGLRKYYVERGIPESKINIINIIVDAKRFEGIRKDDNSERYIAYCGTASNNKDGVDQLIKAFAIVADRDKNIKLYIIGDTPSTDDSRKNEELIKRLGIKERIVFTGKVSAEQMPQLLMNAQILALARPDNIQAKYGFPTKLGEYLLTGNPVVVTAVGDIPLFLKDKKNAMIAPPDNSAAFAEKIAWLLDNPELAKAIGENGKNTALSEFNDMIETKKLLDIINK